MLYRNPYGRQLPIGQIMIGEQSWRELDAGGLTARIPPCNKGFAGMNLRATGIMLVLHLLISGTIQNSKQIGQASSRSAFNRSWVSGWTLGQNGEAMSAVVAVLWRLPSLHLGLPPGLSDFGAHGSPPAGFLAGYLPKASHQTIHPAAVDQRRTAHHAKERLHCCPLVGGNPEEGHAEKLLHSSGLYKGKIFPRSAPPFTPFGKWRVLF